MNQFSIAFPELFLLCGSTILLVVDSFLPIAKKHFTWFGAQITLIICLYLLFFNSSVNNFGTYFYGGIIYDNLSLVLRSFILLLSIIALLYMKPYLYHVYNKLQGEWIVLFLFAVLGMLVLSSAHNLLVVYLGIELYSLPVYAMLAIYGKKEFAIESAVKYFILGAIASGMILYGFSMLYGLSGSLDLSIIMHKMPSLAANYALLLSFALIFIVIGVAFKFGAVPFHNWLPDVYEGAPALAVLFIASIPKLISFALVIRVLSQGMSFLDSQWAQLLTIMAVLSLAIGNISAVKQNNLKRLLAYSAIGHVGFILLGIITHDVSGYAASLFYVIVYAIMTLAAFGFILLCSIGNDNELNMLKDYKGLYLKNPLLAMMMMFIMLSMAGIPPFAGFFIKLNIINVLLINHHYNLAIIAVLFAVIGAYYYMRVIWLMYFEQPEANDKILPTIDIANNYNLAKARVELQSLVMTNAIGLLVLGIFSQKLLAICNQAFNI